MDFSWGLILDFGIISIALLLSTFIRSRVSFFQKYLIPNALTAGFILLIMYNFVFPALELTTVRFGEMVYHLLNVSFIAMTLRKPPPKEAQGNSAIFATSVAVLSQYALQALLGLLITFLFMSTLFPNLFPSFGFLLPLGFVLGPGQAFAIGNGWEPMGFAGAGTVGLTFAAVGFLWACFGGVFLINYGIRRGWVKRDQIEILRSRGVRTGLYQKHEEKPVGSRLSTETEAIDSMTFHLGLIFFTYLLSYLLLKGLTALLGLIGPLGYELAVNLWGINFVFSAVVAMLVRLVASKLDVDYTFDNHTLSRFSGLSVDVMVAAAVGGISLVIVGQYLIQILILSAIAGSLALLIVPWFCSRIYTDHQFYRMLLVYGVSTGTLPTGLALLRVVDPNFETPAASDYMFSTGITFLLAIPFILSINLPAYSVTN
ncbi:MAG: sodium:glutamate symporter, partial [Spirochaetaceae bacterium]|nr:sodium:glutamate symporter [Spirochaetaceae bacterium]MCF7950295.1 sodium:glutamate symporter [Spirochaetaceae bacterium]